MLTAIHYNVPKITRVSLRQVNRDPAWAVQRNPYGTNGIGEVTIRQKVQLVDYAPEMTLA